MADHKAARERAAAFLEGHTEAVDRESLPILDECSICLETYAVEQPVRVTMEGCTHIFGRSCLSAILTNSPRLEKRCPLCRTLWIPAPAPALDAGSLNPQTSESDPYMDSLTARADRGQASASAQPRLASRARPPPAVTAQRRTQPRIINLIDSEDDEEDPQESFDSFNRDIADIRTRARTGLLSRKQRKEERKQNRNPSSSGVGASAIKREGGTTNEQRRQEQQTCNVYVPVLQSLTPSPNMTLETFGLPSASQGASRSDADQRGANNNSGQNQPQEVLGGTPNQAEDLTWPRRISSINAIINHQQPGPLYQRRGALHPNPFLASSSPDNDGEANRKQKEQLDKREKELKELEEQLRIQRRRLTIRERMLNERDRALFQREQRVAQREQSETRIAEMRLRHLTEMEAMIARHREEMRGP